MEGLLGSKKLRSDQMSDTLESIWTAFREFGQRVSPGPVPLAIIIRPRISVATAVAARIVKNQYRRFPRRKKGIFFPRAGRGRSADATAFVPGTGEPRIELVGLAVRRWGEIQGQIIWNWRLLRTPDRP
jgi:hypothetical protein